MALLDHDKTVQAVKHWVETSVIGLNLCPFAKREFLNQRIRFSVAEVNTEVQLLSVLKAELELLNNDEPLTETTLLIHPQVLQNFMDYNEFLDLADGLLVQMELEGIIQVASFHPDYQFAGTEPDDVENYSNRSPFPLLHLIKEQSLEYAIAHYPEPDKIPQRNIDLLKKLGKESMQTLFQSHLDSVDNG
ncbi:MAG: hypothetical protein COB23_03650 [Methylophaga sp.]|nr:MAG: hypothetical protein COB23_03650 [Methylophaga sp.]